MSRLPFDQMLPLERERFLEDLKRRMRVARGQIEEGRRSFEVLMHAPQEGETVYMAPRHTLLLGGLDHSPLLYEWDMVLSDLQEVLKTVNKISGERLDEVRHRLIEELKGIRREEKTESGPGANCG